MHVTLPRGPRLDPGDGPTGADAAAKIGAGLARAALAVKADGVLQDLARPLHDGAQLEIVTERSPEALELIRHDAAHVMATAVLELYPGVKISIGPPIADGLYYDFEFPARTPITPAALSPAFASPAGTATPAAALPKIEEQMRKHVKADEPFTRVDVGVGEAL